ncbi:uncharacterized protein B0T15DRAFT_325431 [Chaetomium strumarium]|uniref:Nephrocystin 3-like N-terminal domain-containing protein n=1 Tax=Chaetomium strumarium TaxID=1170767 RepID=A0AAJ0GKY8_9PEZI|nr:hypothetical protein B0T15DRAFT_325431 [Chaetomium strumarium]
MLLSLLSQSVSQDEVFLDSVYQRCIRTDQEKIQSLSLLRELAELVLAAHTTYFIFVDGLDECLGVPGEDFEKAQREVIDWLESLGRASGVSHGHEASVGDNEHCIWLLASAQRSSLLEERLSQWETIQLDSVDSHLNDIKVYVESESTQIQRKFHISIDARLDLTTRVLSTAKGMFLYAKVELGNLLNQYTVAFFKRELVEENFPKGMDQA